MEFFIPGVAPENYETELARIAERCGRPVPQPAERIQSIEFLHSGQDRWTAEVGKETHGERTERRRRQGKMTDVTSRLSSSGIVRVIFPGDPIYIALDENQVSSWENPFIVGGTSVRAKKLFDS